MRSAAADEHVLAEFLEASLRVPDLSLPPRKCFNFPQVLASESDGISSHALVSSDANAVLREAFHVTGTIDARFLFSTPVNSTR